MDGLCFALDSGSNPLRSYQWSYWEEDAIDGGFRHRPHGERWLISGFGDSALTDLMRLKIKRFRHAELPQWFGAGQSHLILGAHDHAQ